MIRNIVTLEFKGMISNSSLKQGIKHEMYHKLPPTVETSQD